MARGHSWPLALPLVMSAAMPACADNSKGPFQPLGPGAASPPVEIVIPDGNGNTAPPSTSLPLTIGGTVSVSTPAAINGSGVVHRPANTTAYTGNQLIANNTSGNVAPAQIAVTGTSAGTGKITAAFAVSSYTGASPPPTQYWHLFANAGVTVAGLADGSAYVGPYLADLTNGYYLGTLTCASWQTTNDSTAKWFSPCAANNQVMGPLPFKALAGQTYLYALVETGAGGYTPNAGEVETLLLSADDDR
ncbi:MAG TPA: hypothetical protein VG651_13790 [Stellaceae bacterium]|nr:hypothetical protein [Stellaceae bacterium]